MVEVEARLNFHLHKLQSTTVPRSLILTRKYDNLYDNACYLLNMRVNKDLIYTTSKQTYTGRHEDIFKLRTFGTKVYVYIPKWDKMAPNFCSVMLVRVDEHTKDFLCFSPVTKTVTVSGNITVDES